MRRFLFGPICLLLLIPALAGAAESALVVVRGSLDSDLARSVAAEVRKAAESGVDAVLLDFDVDGAPESGLLLAEEIAKLAPAVRIAAFVSGRAPGGATAAVLACGKVYMADGATIGPIPDRGRIREAVSASFAARGLPRTALSELYPRPEVAGGIDAATAESLRIADRVVGDRAEVYGLLGVEPPAEPAAEPGRRAGRLRVTGVFRKPFLIPFEGEIDDTLAESVRRRVTQAKEAGADLIIFEMDSPGGLVSASMDIGDLVFQTKVPTVMLILEEAYSGAALVALARDEIVRRANGVLGDCQPISITPSGYEVIGEKIQSPLRAVFRKYAEKSGYPIALAESMVTQPMEVRRVTFADGTLLYLAPEQVEGLEQEHGKAVREEVVVEAEKLLTMHGKEARDLGFTGDLVESRREAYERLGITEDQVTVLEETWAEGVSRWLMGVKFLLFFVGLVAAWMEIKAPGFGLPGASAIIAFTLFFTASSISGISSGVEIVLFILGLALLAIEVLVIPGFGVPGILGILLMVSSLYLASVKYGLPSSDRPWEVDGFVSWLASFGGTMLAVLIGMFAVAKFLPHTAIGRRLILSHGGPEGALGLTGSGSLEGATHRDLAGRRGRALSILRPSGRIEVDGEPYNAVTEGDWIEAGEDIVVAEVSGNRILVRKA